MNKNHKELEPIKQDENRGEVVFEMRYHLSWWDCIVTIVMFLFGCIMILPVIFSFPEIEKHYILFELVWCGLGFGICWCFIYLIFYTRKNRFYITYQGIGFERRNWFRMQKKFFRFGEVGYGIVLAPTGLCPMSPPYMIYIFPLGALRQRIFRPKHSKSCWIFSSRGAYLSPKLYDEMREQSYLQQFLVKKTKEALESQGIDTTTLPYDLEKQFAL